jgi:hypothetical protein
MNQEPRPAAWIEDLKRGSEARVRRALQKEGLMEKEGRGQLRVEPVGTNGYLAVLPEDLEVALDEEGRAGIIERAEVALREEGFGLILTRCRQGEGWAAPWLKIYGVSAEGPGPRTVRQTVNVPEMKVIDLSTF